MYYERIGSVLPESFRNWLQAQLDFAGIKIGAERFLGALLLFSFLIAVFVGNILFFLLKVDPILSGIAVFAILLGAVIFLVVNSADSEGKGIEKILPDALQLIASNIKAGFTTERALLASALPEFGALSTEMKQARKIILSGTPVDVALVSIARKIKSNVLDRTMWLISEGIRNGGQISSLLLQLSSDLREENALKSEVNANISMYVMLIFFSAAFGAPVLFGISSFIVGVLSEQSASANLPTELIESGAQRNPALSLLGGSATQISEGFVLTFVEVALFITCIFSSLVLGIIVAGNEKGGIKFIPIIMIISFAVFFGTRIIVNSAFGSLM